MTAHLPVGSKSARDTGESESDMENKYVPSDSQRRAVPSWLALSSWDASLLKTALLTLRS